MIKKINIRGYKNIRDMELTCSRLNLLTGENMSGKTAVIKAMTLELERIKNSKNHIRKDWFSENLCRRADKDEIFVELREEGGGIKKTEIIREQGEIKAYMFRDSAFHGLDKAVRFPIWDSLTPSLWTRISVPSGTPYWYYGTGILPVLETLYVKAGADAPESLLVKDENVGHTILEQVNYWFKKIINMSLMISREEDTFSFYFVHGNHAESPSSVSPGVLYVASIIITCMTSPDGTLICIEDPETWLHPKAQSAIAEFLYFTARSGRQVFAETHSDHILNAVRVGICGGKINPDDVSINFLAFDTDARETKCSQIKIGKHGNICGVNNDPAPDGFFDQYEKDLNAMLGL